jgi:hypothetical protein
MGANANQKVDVCIVTLRGLSQEFYDRLYKAIPVNNVIIDNTTTPLGKAREAVIRKVQTDRFVFLDDDVYLPPNWYGDINKFWTTKDIGWIEGWALPSRPSWYSKWSKSRFDEALPQFIPFNGRGFTLDTVIETRLVKDWVSPPDLDFFEDLALSNFVVSKGYKVLRVPVLSEHRIPYNLFDQMRKGAKAANRKTSARISFSTKTFLSGVKASFKTGDASIAYNALKLSLVALNP